MSSWLAKVAVGQQLGSRGSVWASVGSSRSNVWAVVGSSWAAVLLVVLVKGRLQVSVGVKG